LTNNELANLKKIEGDITMQWFHNLKIGAKIISIIVVMGIFMGVIGFIGFYYSNKLSASLDGVYKNYLLPVQWLNDARN
jgi:methyl-accepting chemotaxis protein